MTTRLLFLLLVVLGCNSCRTTSRTTDPWFYVVAADPQLYMKQKDDAYWRETVTKWNGLQPDFVVVCGDLIHGANASKEWKKPEAMAHHNKLADDYWNIAKDLQVPLYNVAGNHDVSLQPTAETIAWYTDRFGSPWYSFTHKNSLFVVLESNLIRDGAGAPDIAQKQWNWFVDTVKTSSAMNYQHKTIYMHHPVCIKDVNEKSDYHNLPLDRRKEMLALLHEHDFDAVFCGHYHKNAYVQDGDLELITTASCCAPLGKDPRGFRIVKVYPDRLEHAYHATDNVTLDATTLD